MEGDRRGSQRNRQISDYARPGLEGHDKVSFPPQHGRMNAGFEQERGHDVIYFFFFLFLPAHDVKILDSKGARVKNQVNQLEN